MSTSQSSSCPSLSWEGEPLDVGDLIVIDEGPGSGSQEVTIVHNQDTPLLNAITLDDLAYALDSHALRIVAISRG